MRSLFVESDGCADLHDEANHDCIGRTPIDASGEAEINAAEGKKGNDDAGTCLLEGVKANDALHSSPAIELSTSAIAVAVGGDPEVVEGRIQVGGGECGGAIWVNQDKVSHVFE